MIIDARLLTKPSDSGRYGTVYFTNDSRAIKVFKKHGDKMQDCRAKEIYDSEFRAYEIATASTILKDYIPAFHCKVEIESIIDLQGNDISSKYWLEQNYVMTTISGNFIKLGSLTWEVSHPVRSKFKSEGIEYTEDSSAILDCDGNVILIIDFACKDIPNSAPD